MKRIMFALVLALMVSAMVMPTAALAAPAYSSITVLNLGTADASINIYYYNQNGSLATMSGGNPNPMPESVAIGASETYFPVHTADGFNGSVVIESTEPIAVISNILYSSTPMQISTWNGFEAGGPELLFPLIMKGNNYNDTTFNVQNTTSLAVSVLIHFEREPNSTYAVIPDIIDSIAPWAAHTYDLRTMGQFSAITKWVGSVKVTVQGAGAVAGVVQTIDSLRGTDSAYDGFLVGSTTVEAPLIMTHNGPAADPNSWTSINCQNLGPGATNITVNYVPETGYPARASETLNSIDKDGTAVFLQYGATKWVGTAQIVNSASNQMACVMNILNMTSRSASAYEGFDSALVTGTSVLPFVQFQTQTSGGPMWSSINVKNLSGSTATITVDYKPEPGYPDVTGAAFTTKSVPAGAVGVFLFYDPLGGSAKWLGGAEVSSNVGNIAVVVNQQKYGYVGDAVSTYDGFAK